MAPALAEAADIDCQSTSPGTDDPAAIVAEWSRDSVGALKPVVRVRPSSVPGLVYTLEARVAFGQSDHTWTQTVEATGTEWIEIDILLPDSARTSARQATWFSDLSVKIQAVDGDGDFWDSASPGILKFLWPESGDPEFHAAAEAYSAVPGGTTDPDVGALSGATSDATTGEMIDANGNILILTPVE